MTDSLGYAVTSNTTVTLASASTNCEPTPLNPAVAGGTSWGLIAVAVIAIAAVVVAVVLVLRLRGGKSGGTEPGEETPASSADVPPAEPSADEPPPT